MGCATLRVGTSGRITLIAAALIASSFSALSSSAFCSLSSWASLAAVLPTVQSMCRPALFAPTWSGWVRPLLALTTITKWAAGRTQSGC